MVKLLGIAGAVVLFMLVALGLAITIIPHFLDRVYYEGPRSGHFDGARFRNPDGDADTLAPPTGGSRIGFFWRMLTGNDGRPPWPDRVEVARGKPPPRVQGERLVVTWIGHATVLIQTAGLNILTDPIWSDRTGPFGLGARRVAPPGVAFDELPKIDVVLLSHNHYDHFDIPTLKQLWARDRPEVITGLGNDTILRSAGIPAQTLDWGEKSLVDQCHDRGALCSRPAEPSAVEVFATRAHHWSTRYMSDRNRALWAGFVIKPPSGGNIWFAGDTGMGDGRWPEEAASHGPIRLALIPIGAFRFVPGQMAIGSHIGPVDAVEAYRRSAAARAIAIHWGTFRLSYEGRDTPPGLLALAMKCAGQRGFAAEPIGRPIEVAAYTPPAPVAARPRGELLRCLDTPEARSLR